MYKKIQASAKKILEVGEDGIRKGKKLEQAFDTVDELDAAGKEKVLDELYEMAGLDNLAKWDNLPVSGKGYLGGKTLRRKEIKFWIDEINKISKGKSKLIVLPKADPILKGKQAGFHPFNGNIYVQKGLTEYEIFHEFKHLEEFIKIGKDEYIKGMKVISGDLELDLIRTYKREMYVYNQVMKESKKFNKEQLKHAFDANIKPVLKELEASGIDSNKIKITK